MGKNETQIGSVKKAMEILFLFTEKHEMSLTEITERLKIGKSSAYKYLNTLEHLRLVERDPTTKKYRLGIKILELSGVILENLELRKVARPYLEELARICNETVHLMVERDGEGVYIEKIDSPRAIRMYSQIGKRLPLHTGAVGKALLAHLPEEKVNEIISKPLTRFTENTITDPKKLKEELRRIRERGYALDNEEVEIGLKCVGAPIRDHTGKVIASISISGPSTRFTDEKIQEYTDLVREYAMKISKALGYKPRDERLERIPKTVGPYC
jgi:DNA-binding IclR family transcriptional regulator